MHIPKNHFSEYFKESVMYLAKMKLTFFILTSIELIELATNLIDKTSILFRHNQNVNYNDSKLSTIVLKISPYHHFFNYMKNHSLGNFNTNRIVLIIIASLYILFLLFFLNIKKKNDDNNNINIYILWIKKISINFFDYILFRLLSIYSLDVFIREIIIISSNDNNLTIDILLLFIFIAFLLVISFFILFIIIKYALGLISK